MLSFSVIFFYVFGEQYTVLNNFLCEYRTGYTPNRLEPVGLYHSAIMLKIVEGEANGEEEVRNVPGSSDLVTKHG